MKKKQKNLLGINIFPIFAKDKLLSAIRRKLSLHEL